MNGSAATSIALMLPWGPFFYRAFLGQNARGEGNIAARINDCDLKEGLNQEPIIFIVIQ